MFNCTMTIRLRYGEGVCVVKHWLMDVTKWLLAKVLHVVMNVYVFGCFKAIFNIQWNPSMRTPLKY